MRYRLQHNNRVAFKELIDKLPLDKVHIITISKEVNRRSTDQNSLYWLWLTCISQETGNDVNDLHEYFKVKFLGLVNRVVFGVVVEQAKSTTSLDTKGMKDYLDHIQAFAASELSIILPDPSDMYFEEFKNAYQRYVI